MSDILAFLAIVYVVTAFFWSRDRARLRRETRRADAGWRAAHDAEYRYRQAVSVEGAIKISQETIISRN